MTGRLYVCATPIGNLEDVTLRLLRVLGEVDLVAAEDTRRAAKLLAAHGIHARTVSYHDANERSRLPELMEQLQGGRRVALVTDAGMPSVSDPGYHLVSACREVGVPVEVVPGPSAVLTALVASGLPPARFAFEGFLPRKPGDRSRRMQAIAGDDRTLVFFEAPGRLAETLGAMAEVFGPRRAAVARELTKLHEEVVRGSLPELAEAFGSGPVRGEITVVVEGAVPGRGDLRRALAAARESVEAGAAKGAAASEAARRFGVAKREVYEGLVEG